MIDHELVVRKMVLVTEDLRRLEALAQKSRIGALPPALVDVPLYLDYIRRYLESHRAR